MKDMENGMEMESEEYIKPYDIVPKFGTYESLQTGAPGAKVKK
jgi:hypothetical protein